MFPSKSFFDKLLYGDRTPPPAARRVVSRSTQQERRVLIRRGGRARTYRVNKYGEVFEEK